ncbi:MAG TPA: response regulator transcription factor [Chroococcales cyanobacterium]|jgi:DNA-binding response OmpR family regulator
MRKARVLIAHKDLEFQRLLGYAAKQATSSEILFLSNGFEVLELAQRWLPDLLLLGGELLGLDGIQCCYRLRRIAQFSDVPILVVLEAPRRDDRYRAYHVGAEGIVDVPFDELELVYRIRIFLRHARKLFHPESVCCGELTLDPATHQAFLGTRKLELTPSEFAILSTLASNPDRVISAETLLVKALGAAPKLGNPQVIHTHIRNLRRKIEKDPANPEVLRYVRRGYQWTSLP